MKFSELRSVYPSSTSIIVFNQQGNVVIEETDFQNIGGDNYERVKDLNVYKINPREDCQVTEITLEFVDRVRVTFTTELDGYQFEDDKTYNRYDYEDEAELRDEIESDLDEWIEDKCEELRSYAEYEIEE